MQIKFVMHQDKVTKGAVRYKDESGEHSIYLRKSELPNPYPEEIQVVITDGNS